MERLIILVGRLYKSVAPTKYFFKVPLIGCFMPLVGVVRRPVESPLDLATEVGIPRGDESDISDISSPCS